MGLPLDRISISGFKSIRHLRDFPLKKLNIIVGANCAVFFDVICLDNKNRIYIKGGNQDDEM